MKLSSLVGHVLQLFELIEKSTQPADQLVSPFLRERTYIGSHDRRFISETIFGMIRHRRLVEALLEQFVVEHPDYSQLDAPHHRYLPLYTVYSLAFQSGATIDPVNEETFPLSIWMEYFPDVKVDEFTAWIVQHRALEFLEEDEVVRLGVKYSFQDWMVQEWKDQVGDETEQLLQSLNAPGAITLRVNCLKTTRQECQSRLEREGIESQPTRLSPVGLTAVKRFNTHASPSFKDGWFEVQDEGSQLVSLLAEPKPGNTIIDGCAGAGGKALHMAELMRDEGEIIAIDVDARKLDELGKRAARAGIHSIKLQVRGEMIPGNFIGKADLVLVDAPCSGVGTIRRNPGFKWSVSEEIVKRYALRQGELLEFYSGFVKPGGTLIYSTCSLFRQENEFVVQKFFDAHKDFHSLPPELNVQLQDNSPDRQFVTLYPHRYGTDGFFIALMKRDD